MAAAPCVCVRALGMRFIHKIYLMINTNNNEFLYFVEVYKYNGLLYLFKYVQIRTLPKFVQFG